MIRKCKNCNKKFEHGVSGNMILFCPYCRKCASYISDYGFGPIVPCFAEKLEQGIKESD